MTANTEKLAILGGEPIIAEGEMKGWPPVDDVDREMVLASLNGGVHTFGPNCEAFQREFADWHGARHAILTNSGTAALHMGLAACGVGAGDHVLVTAYSWTSSATCIVHHNGIPVFVDIDFDTINMDVDKIEAAITPRTKAIVAVHLHGLALDMNKVMDVARRHGLKVVEDACQAIGALHRGRKAGALGDCAAFSLNQNKSLCAGEGGVLITDDDDICATAKQVWNFGECKTPSEDRDYHAHALGWMYRGSDMMAAFARAQLTKLEGYLETQCRNAAVLNDGLADIDGLILPTEPEGHHHNWYNYTSRIDMDRIGWTGEPRAMRDAIMKALRAEGVQASVWQSYILPAMTVFQARNAYGGGFPWSIPGANEGVDYTPENYPVARRHCDTHFGMTTPLRAPNDERLAAKVVEAFHKVFDNLDRIAPC